MSKPCSGPGMTSQSEVWQNRVKGGVHIVTRAPHVPGVATGAGPGAAAQAAGAAGESPRRECSLM